MKIRRSRPEADFTIIPNSTLRDDRLSYCARGVLTELLSRPNGWETNADALSDRARRHRGDVVGEGRRGLRSAFKELEAVGYMIRHKEQGEKGRFVTVLEVYDTPQDRGTAHGTSASVTSVDGPSVTGTSSRSTDLRSTEEEEAGEEHSASLAIAREGRHARKQDHAESELKRLYEAARQLDDDRLRAFLVAFEQKRSRVYRKCRVEAINQLKREQPHQLRGPGAVRAVDELSYMYALKHYAKSDSGIIPTWLTRFPLRSVA